MISYYQFSVKVIRLIRYNDIVILLSLDMVFNHNDLPLTLRILHFQVGNENPLLDGFLVGDGVLNDH